MGEQTFRIYRFFTILLSYKLSIFLFFPSNKLDFYFILNKTAFLRCSFLYCWASKLIVTLQQTIYGSPRVHKSQNFRHLAFWLDKNTPWIGVCKHINLGPWVGQKTILTRHEFANNTNQLTLSSITESWISLYIDVSLLLFWIGFFYEAVFIITVEREVR